MNQQTRTGLTTVIATVLMMSEPALARERNPKLERVTLTVCVDDEAGVPAVFLTEAQARAAAVFRMRDIDVKWVSARDAIRLKLSRPFATLVIAEAPASPKSPAGGREDNVMGQAVPWMNRAYVYYDRLLNVASPARDIVTTLGDVMAHELGHLVLPSGHSPMGSCGPAST